jgi:hypothetical protein
MLAGYLRDDDSAARLQESGVGPVSNLSRTLFRQFSALGAPAASAARGQQLGHMAEQLADGDTERDLEQLGNRYFEETFENTDAAVLAFERLAAQAIADGYFLTDISDRFTHEIPDDAKVDHRSAG